MHSLWLVSLLASQVDTALLERAKAILAETPLIDGHNDLPSVILDAAQGDVARFVARDEELERLRRDFDDEREIERRYRDWLSRNPERRGTLSQVADHIDHIRDVAGIDHVGIGSDFYDAGGPSMAEGLEDVTRFPALVAELLRRGYTSEQVKKIAGENLLRVMREAQRVSEDLQKERDPSTADSRPVRAR